MTRPRQIRPRLRELRLTPTRAGCAKSFFHKEFVERWSSRGGRWSFVVGRGQGGSGYAECLLRHCSGKLGVRCRGSVVPRTGQSNRRMVRTLSGSRCARRRHKVVRSQWARKMAGKPHGQRTSGRMSGGLHGSAPGVIRIRRAKSSRGAFGGWKPRCDRVWHGVEAGHKGLFERVSALEQVVESHKKQILTG